MDINDTIIVITDNQSLMRGRRKATELKIAEFSENVNKFIDKIGSILKKTPKKVGKFQFDEFEINAEVSGKGTLSILGTGGEAGAKAGLKFVFRRSPLSGD